MGIRNVIDWTPDSKRIIFVTRRDASNGWTKRLCTVAIEGGLPEPLPMDQGGLHSTPTAPGSPSTPAHLSIGH
jgi:tricorn protease